MQSGAGLSTIMTLLVTFCENRPVASSYADNETQEQLLLDEYLKVAQVMHAWLSFSSERVPLLSDGYVLACVTSLYAGEHTLSVHELQYNLQVITAISPCWMSGTLVNSLVLITS
jgi:hypothetical protein